MSLLERFNKLRSCLPKGVNLLAVSKGHPASSIRQLTSLGQLDFGESRLQEALPKISSLEDVKNIRWHFIGHLQSNKARGVVQFFEVIHSVHSVTLAKRISRIAGEESRCPLLMLQVKFLKDDSKAGFLSSDLLDSWPVLVNLPHVKIVGLMAITPLDLDFEKKRMLFESCRHLANQLNLPECSMGMSNDWQEAIGAGATWIRVGSSLFGKRP